VRRLSRRRIRAIIAKELQMYRRTGSIVVTMSIIPLIFLVQPVVSALTTSSAAAASIRHHHELLYMLAIPALVPAMLAAYAVVGERAQGTLEPVLTTPLRREELILGKALAVAVPAIVLSYVIFAIFLAIVGIFAHPGVSSALIRGSDVLAQVIFTPLIATWSIWIAMAISTRATDIRVAQQLSVLASLPTIAVTTLIAFNVLHPSLRLALGLGVGLLVLNRVAWRFVSMLFDRERLIVGTRT
jgi:ABC-type transport system involved in multi-copper enzyme maturation permease subunit